VGELRERLCAHLYETGGVRRTPRALQGRLVAFATVLTTLWSLIRVDN
jgi:hypothetical protein